MIKKERKKYLIRRLIALCILVLIIIGILVLVFKMTSKSEKTQTESRKIEPITLSFESKISNIELLDAHEMAKVGWIQVQGTNIDYPVMVPGFDDFNTNNINYVWRSPNYTSGEFRETILGHNIVNVSSHPLTDDENLVDFEPLMSFVYYDFAKDNMYIQYTKDGEDKLYVIYAIGFYDYSEINGGSFETKEETKQYIEKVKNNSIYNYNLDVDEDDELLTLITCTRFFGLDEKQQFVIDARLVKNGETPVKYIVEKNQNYDIMNLD